MAYKRLQRVSYYVFDLGNGYVLDLGACRMVAVPDDLSKLPYRQVERDFWSADIQCRPAEADPTTMIYSEKWKKSDPTPLIDSTDALQAMFPSELEVALRPGADQDEAIEMSELEVALNNTRNLSTVVRSMQSSELDEDQSKISRPVAI